MAKYLHSKVRTQSRERPTIKIRQSSTPTGTSSPVPKIAQLLGAVPQHDKVLKEGWILKKSKRFKHYDKRFMQLKGDKLVCYKTNKFRETNESPTITFDLSFHRYRADKHDTVKEKFYLIDETTMSSRTFKAYTESDRDEWVHHIRNNIISGKMLRQSSLENIHQYYGGKNVQTPMFATFESEMGNKNIQEMHDSESEESDDDFGGYSFSMITKTSSMPFKKNKSTAPDMVKKKSTMSRRKTNYAISRKSFQNFRIRSLTVEMSNDIEMESDEDKDMEPMMTLTEEKEEFSDDDDDDGDYNIDDDMANMAVLESDNEEQQQQKTKDMDIDGMIMNDVGTLNGNAINGLENMEKMHTNKVGTNKFKVDVDGNNAKFGDDEDVVTEMTPKVYDEGIIEQLKMFGYERDEILKAMEDVINPNNINQIREQLEEEDNATMDAVIDAEMNKNMADMPQTPNPELYAQSTTESLQDLMGYWNGGDTEEMKREEIEDMMQDELMTNSKIEKKARMRKFIEQEIISTEETYYKGLDTLLNELLQPIFDNGYIDKKYYKEIRSSLPQILGFHKDFWCQLNAINQIKEDGDDDNDEKLDKNVKGKTLAAVFNHCIMENKEKFIEIYIEFIKDYDKILDLFGSTFHGNLELETFLKEKRRERKPLSGFLILPVQRVPRYILLLTDLRKNTEETSDDYKDINDAVKMINDITQEINEKKRKIENLSQCLQIQEALNGLKEPIVNDDRVFIEQFIFIKKTIKHQRLLFLFNDIVIIANEKWKVKHILDIRTLDVKIGINDIHITKRKELPEFQLVAVGIGSVVYVGQDIKTLNRFKRLVGKWRVKIMSGDIRERNESLGSIKDELARQTLMFD